MMGDNINIARVITSKCGDSYLVMVMEAMEFNKLSQLLLMMDPIMLELWRKLMLHLPWELLELMWPPTLSSMTITSPSWSQSCGSGMSTTPSQSSSSASQCCNEDWKWTEDEDEESSDLENRPKTRRRFFGIWKIFEDLRRLEFLRRY